MAAAGGPPGASTGDTPAPTEEKKAAEPKRSAEDKLLLACCRAIRKESGWQHRTLRQACDWATSESCTVYIRIANFSVAPCCWLCIAQTRGQDGMVFVEQLHWSLHFVGGTWRITTFSVSNNVLVLYKYGCSKRRRTILEASHSLCMRLMFHRLFLLS